jgi:hypothetical protein
MRKLLSTAVILGLTGLLIGCPAKTGKTAKTGDKTAKTGSSASQPAKTDEAKTEAAKTEAAKTSDTGTTKTREPEPAKPAGIDLSGVSAGQVYVYKSVTEMGGKVVSEMTMKYKVVEVTDKKVKYQMIMVMAGKETPQPEAWYPADAPKTTTPTETPKTDSKTTSESIEIGGKSWDCKVTTTEANGSTSQAWVPQANGTATWPMFVKSVTKNPASKMVSTTTLEKVE